MKLLVTDVAAATNFDTNDLSNSTGEALVNLGMDSLGLAQVVEMLKFKYNCPVPDQWVYFETTTLDQVCKLRK
jgi:acyl carrier protein